jgi:UDP-N-acetylglucosamine 2-epimerase (non-hydrolysing)
MPEELNRILTDALSALLLTTEASARDNLLAEGRPADAIHFVGNVMIDTLVSELPAARALHLPRAMGLSEREFAYVTLHRPRNVDNPDRLRAFVDVLLRLSERLPVVFVVHPRTGKQLAAGNLYGAFEGGAAIHLLEPQPYQRNLALLSAARLILTDSGGVQEEAAYLGIPCLTLRPNTERPVTLEGGLNQLVPHAPQGVLDAVERVLAAPLPEVRQIPGWDGQAGERVANVLLAAWAL